MTPKLLALAAIAALTGNTGLAEEHASDDAAEFLPLRVGLTGIACYTEPCPWNGVVRDDLPVLPSSVIWSGRQPPPMIAAPADKARIRAAYGEGCTKIRGRFIDGNLEVAEVLGPC